MEGTANRGTAQVTLVFTDASGTQEAALPDGAFTFEEMIESIRQIFGQAAHQDLIITDGQSDIKDDADVQQLLQQPGQRLLVHPAHAQDAAVFKERISFTPHPKTLTMAGDYEYFAAQGYHPLAFALAELIDNSLRATKGNSDCPRSITVSLVTDDKGSKGMVCVRDNGSGMSTQELNNWAVMNLSMEDRGLLTTDEPKAGSRYLSSDISYFGVGSKNAAFYLGETVKVVTKTRDSSYVHELCIQAAELERRYREGQAVYEEVMLHRQPGDAGSMGKFEAPFQHPQELVEQEVVITSSMDEPGSSSSSNTSFTRVLIYDLKSEVLEQLCDDDQGATILRDLAHLYHYYLHGEQGNDGTCRRQDQLPNGERVPAVVVERLMASGSCCWSKALVEVHDDLESRYLAAQRAKLEFALSVPNHGRVEGVLWYFPFDDDQETVPLDPHTMGRMLLMSNRSSDTAHTQNPGAAGGGGLHVITQLGGPSQVAAWQSQRPAAFGAAGTQAAGPGIKQQVEQDAEDIEAAGLAALLATCPTFETFWQGRLIPGACVDTLPFIRAVRSKRSAAAKDLLPDEVFSRIRGALFLGPGFRVTRNKLTFRDNLSLLLESGTPSDRQLEKKFKDWLVKCHKELDRTIKFEQLCSLAIQTKARSQLGQDVTVFDRICDGLQTINKGDIIRLNTKPAIFGRVEHFSVPQVVQAEGCYSGGRVTVCALPSEVLGPDNLHTWPLRRVDGKVSQAELAEHVSKELAKLPHSLQFEPMKLSGPTVSSLPAGSILPETSISVLNGNKTKIVKALMCGKRHHLEVVQTLYYLGPAGTARKRSAAAAAQQGNSNAAPADPDPAAEVTEEGAGKKGGKRSKRRKKATAAAEKENDAPVCDATGGKPADGKQGTPAQAEDAAMEDYVPEGEVVLKVENKSPLHDAFQFQRINGGLTRAGCYCLQYSLRPELPNGRTLRFSIDLEVSAGAPVGFDIKGQGRAIALSKSILLGEALPLLYVQFQDSHGNLVPISGDYQPAVTLQLLEAGPGGGGAVLQELQAVADMELQSDGVYLQNLRVVGSPAAGSSGMQLFKPPPGVGPAGASAAASSGQRATRGTVHCAGAAAAAASAMLPIVRAVDVFLAAHIEGMPQQGFPLRLAPGAPQTVQLLNGHPFTNKADSNGTNAETEDQQPLLTQLAPEQRVVPAEVLSGEQLHAFKVLVLDAWGNATCPHDSLPFDVRLDCAAAEPTSSTFSVDDRGVATISGVNIYRQDTTATAEASSQQQQQPTSAEAQMHLLSIQPDCSMCGQPLMQQAVQAAEPLVPLKLQLAVLPSNMPAELLMTYKGEELERRIQKGADGEEVLVWQLNDVQAGEKVTGLAVRCVDEVGRPATAGVKGRVQASWLKGSKKAVLSGDDIKLPSLNAQDAVGEPQAFWVRFIGDPKEWPGVTLDIQLEVSVMPGPPASWGVAIVERYRTSTAAAVAAGQAEDAENLSFIPCGKPFTLEIEALDAHHNRCCFAIAEERPTPVVRFEPEDSEVQLTVEPDTWVHKWDNTQAGGEVCQFKLWLAGPPGPIRLIVRDEAGEDGASLLAPDELPIQLLPGPAAALVADCPQQLECGVRGLLEALPIKVVDGYGNFVDNCSFEVSLNGSAFNADGSLAARVAASGSNRTKLRNGVATFRSVRVQAAEEGEYRLTIGSVSRKVAVQEAVVTVKVTQQNCVCNLEVLPACLPPESSGAAGASLLLLVALDTEDQQAAPWEAVSNGLSLSLEPPAAAGAADATRAGGKGKGGRGSKAAVQQPDLMVLMPECLWDASQQLEGLTAEVAAAAEAAAQKGCVVCFRTPALPTAGGYVVAADYRETRPQLLSGLAKEEQHLRSISQQFEIVAGPVTTAVLQAAGAGQQEFSISNGKDPAARRLLRNAAVQLLDDHGNAAAVADVPMRWQLHCADEASRCEGAEAPQLHCSDGELQQKSDERGRAFFGDVEVEQDSGRMAKSGAAPALQCKLELQVLLARPKSRRSGSLTSNWLTVWERPVLFCDDAARIRELQAMQEQREQLQQQFAAVKQSMDEVAQRVSQAQHEYRAAKKAAEGKLQELQNALKQPELQLPSSSSAARGLLERIKQQQSVEQDRPEVGPRYGGSRHPIALGISKLLQLSDPEVVGVFAQLGYVNNRRLSAVLAANYASALQVMVVKSYDAIKRLKAAAQEAKVPVPSMLPYTLIQPFQPETAACGTDIQMQGVSELAQQLMADACQGSDPPLVMALPHTRQLSLNSRTGQAPPKGDSYLAASDWPDGCLGFAVNLVRPAQSNTRHLLMYAQLGRTLVFESIDQAARYREYVCKVLRSTTADIVSLCGNKLSGRGVVLGSTFRVVPVEEAPCRFGTIPRGQQTFTQLSITQRENAAEGLMEALQQQEEAEQELQAAHAAAQHPEQQQLQQQQAELQQQLEQLSEGIKQQQHSIGANSKGTRHKIGMHPLEAEADDAQGQDGADQPPH